MVAVETRLDHGLAAATGVEATGGRGEPLADRVLSFAAMGGAVVGAVAGTVLGAEAGTAFPLACGTLGTMIGSGVAAGAGCLLARLWTGPAAVPGGHPNAQYRTR